MTKTCQAVLMVVFVWIASAEVNAQPVAPVITTLTRVAPIPFLKISNIGPFCSPSLNAIKLQIDRQVARWYFTKFLDSDPAGSYVKRYLPAGFVTQPLPADVPVKGRARHIPGAFPSDPNHGISNLRLQLDCVRYSRRYGGSVELVFRSEETFEFEARQGSTLWDFDHAELSMFMVPIPGQLNAGPVSGTNRLHLELRVGALLAYTEGGAAGIGVSPTSDQRAAFDSLWSTTATEILADRSNNFRSSLYAFVYGFIHYLFNTTLAGPHKVSMMELDQDYLGLTTTTGIPIVHVAIRVADIDIKDRPLLSGVTLSLTTTASWDSSLTSAPYKFNLLGQSATPPHVFLVFPLSTCPTPGPGTISLTGTYEKLYPAWSNTSSFGPNTVSIDCDLLRANARQSAWGDLPSEPLAFSESADGGRVGSLNIYFTVGLRNR